MGVPLLAGREFSEADREGAQKVAVVNESFARHFFGEAHHTLGHYFTKGAGDVKPDIEIVGVVKDAKHENVRSDIKPTTFTLIPAGERPLETMTLLQPHGAAPRSGGTTIGKL